MACSNARSRKLSAGSERLGKTAILALFLFALDAASAHAQFVEDVFTTPSYDIECTFRPSAGPELSCDRFGPRHLRFLLSSDGPGHMFTVPSDDRCCSTDNVLEPGMTWSQPPFVCRYGRNGLTCERERHGFHIDKKVVVAY
jgi:hypothetical protein